MHAWVAPRIVVALAVVATATGCGSDSSDAPAAGPRSSTAAEEEPAPAGLPGEWRTVNVCADEVRALKQAGLGEFAREWVADAEYPGASAKKVAPGKDPCRGAKPMKHSHSFGQYSTFASFNQNGQRVHYGNYSRVGPLAFTLSDPPVTVRYRIKGDEATFKVVAPHCKAKTCRESAAFVISTFFPRTYKRVP